MIWAKKLKGGQQTSQGGATFFFRATREIIAAPDQNPVYVPIPSLEKMTKTMPHISCENIYVFRVDTCYFVKKKDSLLFKSQN